MQERNDIIKNAGVTPPTTKVEVDKLTKALGKITEGEAKDLDNKLDINTLQNTAVAAHLSENTIDNLEQNSKYSKEEIEAVKVARKTGIANTINGQAALSLIHI